MMKSPLKYALFTLVAISCTAGSKTFNKKEYRKSKTLRTYTCMSNELEDDCFALKENGYFAFYKKLWIVVNIKEAAFIGRYTRKNDTLYLTWQDGDPQKISDYLSTKCIIDSTGKTLQFINEFTGQPNEGRTMGAQK